MFVSTISRPTSSTRVRGGLVVVHDPHRELVGGVVERVEEEVERVADITARSESHEAAAMEKLQVG